MTTRYIAIVALVGVVVLLVLQVWHAVTPTPPAHAMRGSL